MTSFYSEKELAGLGLKSYGENVQLSRKISFYSPEKIQIGSHVRIDDFCILSGTIQLGSFIHIGAYSGLFGSEGIRMEDYSGLSSRVSIYTVSEDYLGKGMTNPTVPAQYRFPEKAAVALGKHVIVGAGTVILPGCHLQMGVAVGALSLVIGDCKPWGIYAGVPAKLKSERRQDLILEYEKKMEKPNHGF